MSGTLTGWMYGAKRLHLLNASNHGIVTVDGPESTKVGRWHGNVRVEAYVMVATGNLASS